MTRVLPWLVAALALAVAVYSWVRPVPDAQEPEATDRAAATPPTTVGDLPPREALHATQACLGRLELAQTALRRCRGAARTSDSTPEGIECLSDPDVIRVVEQRIEDAIRDHVEAERDRVIRARERERSAFDEWSKEALELSTEESEWLESYVCAARELRTRTLSSLEEQPATQALEQLKQHREQILKDLEKALGPERYATLRAIGGIGLVADTTECG
jgi:hypothetical protein